MHGPLHVIVEGLLDTLPDSSLLSIDCKAFDSLARQWFYHILMSLVKSETEQGKIEAYSTDKIRQKQFDHAPD
jgi:hypothetical protein